METTHERPGSQDTQFEKKWFVYVVDHHEGPFSVADLRQMTASGRISSASYVWCQGMADWEVITQVSALQAVLSAQGTGTQASSALVDPQPSQPEAEARPQAQQSASAPATIVISPTTTVTKEAAEEPSIQPIGELVELQPASEATTPRAHTRETAQPQTQVAQAAPAATPRSEEPVERTQSMETPQSASTPVARKKSGSTGKLLLFLLLLVIVAGVAASLGYMEPVTKKVPGLQGFLDSAGATVRGALAPVGEKVPFVGKIISPIPSLSDVKPEEYADLKKAAAANLEKDGAQVAVALSQTDLASPKLYVASNLPEGTQFEVRFIGISDTLLGEMNFTGTAQSSISRKLGTTPPLKGADGKQLPRGQYIIYVTEAQAQPAVAKSVIDKLPPTTANVPASLPKDVRAFAYRSYFLGGPNDATYTARLKEYHDRLREKATIELSELKQFAATLEGQVSGTVSEFKRQSSGKLSAGKKKAWQAFSEKWKGLMAQMDQTLQKLTPETLQNEYFYGMLYQQLQKSAQAVQRLHDLQDSFFAGTADANGLDIRVGEATAQAEGAINEMKAKIEQAEKMPPSPNGMPQREGL